ncbi:MAG: helix-hairpin-helix domain-containing protein [Actinomycetota bacterium]
MELNQPDLVARIIEFISFRFDQEVDRWQVIAALCVALLVIMYSSYNLFRAWSARGVQVIATTANEKNNGTGGGNDTGGGKSGSAKKSQWLFVYLCGAVQKPGVYRVGAGTRLNAAIALAGGLAAEGNGNAVNMARLVVDGERIYIPKVGEKLSTTTSIEGLGSSEGSGSGSGGGSGSDSGAGQKDDSGRININTANAAALDTIPGIGPTLAGRIIDHRQKRNGFTDINQLGEVEGIGPKTFAKIKPYIYVE